MATFGAFVLLSSLIAAAIVWRGYVVAILWGWFVSTNVWPRPADHDTGHWPRRRGVGCLDATR
jgi:hypothetical protein